MTVVGFLSLELHFPSARSLKDKRSVLRSVKDRLRKHNVSVAEVDHQDLWQRCELAMVVVGSAQTSVEQSLHTIVDEVERREPGIIVGMELTWLT
jgi:hypothetical protein